MTRHTIRALAVFLTGYIAAGPDGQVHGQQTDREAYVRKAVVVDANGVPLAGANVYDNALFYWDARAAVARWTPTEPSHRTDPNGEFSFDVGRLGSGPIFFIANDSLDLMGYLRGSRKDPGETRTIRLERPARIKAVFQSRHVVMDEPSLKIGFYEPEKRTIHGTFITVVYDFQEPLNDIPLDVACPSGCPLYLMMSAGGGILPVGREIPPLKPGEVLDLGSIEPDLRSGYKAIGRQAPELRVAAWVKGPPVTLAELKGKTILLVFCGSDYVPSSQSMPRLVALHRKYTGDGLVIIAVRDASSNGASPPGEGRDLMDLSDTSFRVAVDIPLEQGAVSDGRQGQGQTADAYGIIRFPTELIVNPAGQVEDTEHVAVEDRIHLLLYGQRLPRPTATSRLLAANPRLFIKAGVAIVLVGILVVVLTLIWLR